MKNTTLRQLIVFETVARHLHFTRAAKELGTTQPSVSLQIRQIEDNLGIALFEQMGKRIHLTEAGRELYRSCREITRQLAEAETALERLKGVQGGRLRLAIAPTAKYFISRLLAVFVRQHPGVSIDLLVASRDELLAQLDENARDMVVMTSPPEEQTLVAEPFLDEPLVAIAPPGHALAGKRSVAPERLVDWPFLLREQGSATRRQIECFFGERGHTLEPVLEVNSNEAIKQAVQAGLGVAIVPLQSVVPERDTGRIAVLDIDSLNLQCNWHIVHRHDKRFSCVAEAFRTFVLQSAGNRVAGSGAADGLEEAV